MCSTDLIDALAEIGYFSSRLMTEEESDKVLDSSFSQIGKVIEQIFGSGITAKDEVDE